MFAVPVGSNELELFPSSRPVVEHDKLCSSVEDLKRLSNCDLTIQDSDDPERPINFESESLKGMLARLEMISRLILKAKIRS